MTESGGIWADILKATAANAAIVAALWGAAGGLTSALAVRDGGGIVDRVGRATRQILIGALAASGGGVAMGAVIAKWLSLPDEAIAAIGAGSTVSYMVGVFGPAVIEVLLLRIRRVAPQDTGGEDNA